MAGEQAIGADAAGTARPASDEAAQPVLPGHIEATVKAIAQLHAQHRRDATPTERVVERMGALVARPRFVGYVTTLLAVWIAANLALPRLGHAPLDAPPFPWMETAVSVVALYMTTIILASQRRENELSNLREQLTLELAILSEQKSAKTIQLLEELRRDTPTIPDRLDPEAEEMARPADPQSVFAALHETEAEAEMLDADLDGAGEATEA